MKDEKNQKIIDDYDYLSNAASMQDCTGLIPSEPISIEEYAKNQHISVCWFIRSFRLAMGMPPMQYITSVRLNRARMLLESSDYPIQEIGAMVGYDNPLYFSRIFKKQMGEPPSRYRKH